MQVQPTTLPEVLLLAPRVFGDTRGYFFESWHAEKFAAAGIAGPFVQDNHSHSLRHTLRGLHYQLKRPQGKLIRVTRGEVFDVAVDVRRSSPRFGQWVGALLSETNHAMLWIPPGFAHGYLALSEQVDFLYKCTEFYIPEDERVIRWDDPTIAVRWPLLMGTEPIVSARDAAAPRFDAAECFP
jgi:dTDP-4-dehydrorhamnose 3,5-epimerase